jgi:hypothetical protein
MPLDPTDVVSFVYQGITFTMRVSISNIGVSYTVELSGVSEAQAAYSSVAAGGDAEGVPPSVATGPVDTLLFLYDLPYLRDVDGIATGATGFYWAFSADSQSWPGGLLCKSSDDAAFDTIANSTERVFHGVVSGTLGNPPTDAWTWDNTNSLNVVMSYGTLSGSTDLDVLNGANVLIVGNEVIQYVNCVQTGAGAYTLSRLLRGRRNTEYAATGHGASETVIDPTTGLQRAIAPLSLIGLLRYYRGISVGRDITTATSETLAIAANDLKPASPVHMTGSRDGSNNLTIGWTRRTRFGGDWQNNTGSVPLNEDSEAYEIDILSGVTVLRTITWTPGTYDTDGNPTAAYSAANQTTDGLTPGNPVSVKIYQISAQVGRGFAGVATV